MTPLLRAGDAVAFSAVEPRTLRPGDLVVYRDGDATVCHRFLRAEGTGSAWRMLQKGDAISSGSWIAHADVLGRADVLIVGGRRVDLTRGPAAACQRIAGAYLRAHLLGWDFFGLGPSWPRIKRLKQRAVVVPLDLATRACAVAPAPTDPARRRAILTALCRMPAPAPSELAALLAEVTDWDDVSRMVLAHGIQGIATPRLADPEVASVAPEEVRAALRASVVATATQNLFHRRAMREILDALPPGVELLLAKGIGLAAFAYDRPAMRPMSDVDFYIRPADIDAVERAMATLGYRPEERRQRPREWWIANFQHLEPFVSADGRVRIEAHLRNASAAMPYRLAIGPVWDRSRVRSYDGRPVRVMAADDELAHSVLHLYIHDVHLVRLLGLYDLDRTVRANPDLDWDRLVAVGRAQGYARLLYVPLRLARDLLDTPVPDEALAACRPADLPDEEVAFLADYLFRDDVGREQVPLRVTEAIAARGVARLRVIARAVFPSAQQLRARYNLADGAPVLVHRLAHPLRLARKWGNFIRRFARQDDRQRRLVNFSARVAGWIEREKTGGDGCDEGG
jgi:hypothetical protein